MGNELLTLRKENKQLKMENDILKQATLIMGKKIEIIKHNKQNYSMSKMCKSLEISRSGFYYKKKFKKKNSELENEIIRIFNENRKVYGERRLKKELEKIKDKNGKI